MFHFHLVVGAGKIVQPGPLLDQHLALVDPLFAVAQHKPVLAVDYHPLAFAQGVVNLTCVGIV